MTSHYEQQWEVEGLDLEFSGGPIHELPKGFAILEFPPHGERNMWTYATCCMSQPEDEKGLELHLFCPEKWRDVGEILAATAHFHRTGSPLGVGHTVNLGKAWIKNSSCEYGLVSLPYLDGPELENLKLPNGGVVKCLWLVPLTRSEVEYKKQHGLDALEEQLEKAQFNYLDPSRLPVC